MSRLLEKALEKVAALPHDEQDAIASQILASLADEDAWKTRLRRRLPRLPRPEAGRTGDNAGMDAGELVANILDAIGSGRDLYL
jgi:predicted nucleic acid-binding Zn ribbon protein